MILRHASVVVTWIIAYLSHIWNRLFTNRDETNIYVPMTIHSVCLLSILVVISLLGINYVYLYPYNLFRWHLRQLYSYHNCHWNRPEITGSGLNETTTDYNVERCRYKDVSIFKYPQQTPPHSSLVRARYYRVSGLILKCYSFLPLLSQCRM